MSYIFILIHTVKVRKSFVIFEAILKLFIYLCIVHLNQLNNMKLELKKSFVIKMEKVINKLINGYHVALDSLIDEIYYINSIIFCAPSATIIEGDSSTLCSYTTTTTTLPPVTTTTTTIAPTTTTTTTVAPSCNFNGGTLTLLT